MMVEPDWFKYATFDEHGTVSGVKPDAPDEIKKEYEEYVNRVKNGEKP